MKKSFIIATLAIFTLIGLQAQAQIVENTQSPEPTLYSDNAYEMPSTFGESLRAKKEEVRQEIEARRKNLEMRIEQKRQEIEAMRGEFKNKLVDVRDESKSELNGKLDDFKKEMEYRRLELKNKVAEKVSFHFEAAVERLTKLIDRIQSRIDLIKAAGGDVVGAQAALDKANADLDFAKTKASSVTLVDAINPTTIKSNIDAIKEVKDALVAVQKDLSDVVKLIKSAQANITKATDTN